MRDRTTMRIVRATLLGLAGLGAAGWLSASLMAGGQATGNHLMVVVLNLASLEGLSTDPNNGGPSVMYAVTPYAHIMAPITAATVSARSIK